MSKVASETIKTALTLPPRVPVTITFFMPASLDANQPVRTTHQRRGANTETQKPSNGQPEVGAFAAVARAAREESVTHPPTAGKHRRACLQPADKPSTLVCERKKGIQKNFLISPLFPLRQVCLSAVWEKTQRKKSTPNKGVIHFNEKVGLTNATNVPGEHTRARAHTEED